MNELPQLIKEILRNYCHVEWWEVDELVCDVGSGCQKFDVSALKSQFEMLIKSDACIYETINKLTANEFETDEEAKVWLDAIYRKVFE